MNKREEIIQELEDDEQLKFVNGFDDAIIGVVYDEKKVVYSFVKAIEMLRQNMSEEEAIKYLHFNVIGNKGEDMPIWVMDYYG